MPTSECHPVGASISDGLLAAVWFLVIFPVRSVDVIERHEANCVRRRSMRGMFYLHARFSGMA